MADEPHPIGWCTVCGSVIEMSDLSMSKKISAENLPSSVMAVKRLAQTLAAINRTLTAQMRAAEDHMRRLELLVEDIAFSRVEDAPRVALAALESRVRVREDVESRVAPTSALGAPLSLVLPRSALDKKARQAARRQEG